MLLKRRMFKRAAAATMVSTAPPLCRSPPNCLPEPLLSHGHKCAPARLPLLSQLTSSRRCTSLLTSACSWFMFISSSDCSRLMVCTCEQQRQTAY